MRRCTKCGEEKPLDAFKKESRASTGRASRCKACDSAASVARQKADPDRRVYLAEWRARNGDKLKEYSLRWYHNNPEKAQAARERWLKDNRERQRATIARWHREHPEAVAAKNHRRRVRKYQGGGILTADDVRAQYNTQGGLCFYCATPLGDRYHADHMTPLSRGGTNGPENVVCACPPCNQRKWTKTAAEYMAVLAREL